MTKQVNKPQAMIEEHSVFLDVLRRSGVTNMLLGGVFLQEEYPELTAREARDILRYWMSNCK